MIVQYPKDLFLARVRVRVTNFPFALYDHTVAQKRSWLTLNHSGAIFLGNCMIDTIQKGKILIANPNPSVRNRIPSCVVRSYSSQNWKITVVP